jgi:hypothetical protein
MGPADGLLLLLGVLGATGVALYLLEIIATRYRRPDNNKDSE